MDDIFIVYCNPQENPPALLTMCKIVCIMFCKGKMGKVYTAKKLRKMLEADGWYFVRQDGSHAQFKHSHKKNLTTIPIHDKDMKKGTAASILRQTGLKGENEK
jgi:predicted RNA binding protein YcfA (HicA-like mRNA interferase family)